MLFAVTNKSSTKTRPRYRQALTQFALIIPTLWSCASPAGQPTRQSPPLPFVRPFPSQEATGVLLIRKSPHPGCQMGMHQASGSFRRNMTSFRLDSRKSFAKCFRDLSYALFSAPSLQDGAGPVSWSSNQAPFGNILSGSVERIFGTFVATLKAEKRNVTVFEAELFLTATSVAVPGIYTITSRSENDQTPIASALTLSGTMRDMPPVFFTPPWQDMIADEIIISHNEIMKARELEMILQALGGGLIEVNKEESLLRVRIPFAGGREGIKMAMMISQSFPGVIKAFPSPNNTIYTDSVE